MADCAAWVLAILFGLTAFVWPDITWVVLLFLKPVADGIAIIWTIAAYAVIFGVLLIALGVRLKNQNVPADRQALRSA